jgi:hypothetical protein
VLVVFFVRFEGDFAKLRRQPVTRRPRRFALAAIVDGRKEGEDRDGVIAAVEAPGDSSDEFAILKLNSIGIQISQLSASR